MTAAEVLATMRAAGTNVRLDGDDLIVKSATPATIGLLRQHKAEIVAHLQSGERFVAAVQSIWPGARLLTDVEREDGAQFRAQIILAGEANAIVYAERAN
jgi:hypothetical protein